MHPASTPSPVAAPAEPAHVAVATPPATGLHADVPIVHAAPALDADVAVVRVDLILDAHVAIVHVDPTLDADVAVIHLDPTLDAPGRPEEGGPTR